MVVLPPGRLSTTTVWPQVLPSFSDATRASVSLKPPGGYGTTMRTAWSGKPCAAAPNATTAKEKAASKALNTVRIVVSCLIVPGPRSARSGARLHVARTFDQRVFGDEVGVDAQPVAD